MNKYIVCALCGKKIPIKSLGTHIRIHKVSSKDYYLKYLGKQGYCKTCGNKTNFNTLENGFNIYCCRKCSNKNNDRLKSMKENLFKKSGVYNVSQLKSVKIKKEKTCFSHFGYTSLFKNSNYIKKAMKEKLGVEHPAQRKDILEKMQKTCISRYGFSNPFQSKFVKNKIAKTNIERYGYKNPSKSDFIKRKVKKTNIKKYGYEYPIQNKEIKEKVKNICIYKYGYENPMQSKEIQNKAMETNIKRYGYKSAMQSDIVKERLKKTMLKRYGYENAMKNPIIKDKCFSHRRKEHHGYLSNSEYEFSKKLKKNKYKFKNEYFYNDKNWDFALFKNGKLNTLVEIDGEYFHSIFSDCDGKHSNGYNDYKRFSLLKNTKVKLVVIDSLKLDEGIKEVDKVYSLSYTKYIKRMIRQVSKLKLGYNFSKERMDKDYASLCFYKYNTRQSLGISIVRQFTDFNVKDLDIDKLIKEHTMYYSKCSSHNPLDFIKVTNPSKIRHKYLYDDRKVIKFKKYDIGVVLGILSLSKSYKI